MTVEAIKCIFSPRNSSQKKYLLLVKNERSNVLNRFFCNNLSYLLKLAKLTYTIEKKKGKYTETVVEAVKSAKMN